MKLIRSRFADDVDHSTGRPPVHSRKRARIDLSFGYGVEAYRVEPGSLTWVAEVGVSIDVASVP